MSERRSARLELRDGPIDDVVAEKQKDEHQIVRARGKVVLDLQAVLVGAPAGHAGVGHRHGSTEIARKESLEVGRERLLVFDFDGLQERGTRAKGVADQCDGVCEVVIEGVEALASATVDPEAWHPPAEHDSDKIEFLMASGNVGVMAATNEVVKRSEKWVNLTLFVAVMVLCYLQFRSLRVIFAIFNKASFVKNPW